MDKKQLRKQNKRLRRALSIKQQQLARQNLLRIAHRYTPIWTAKHVLSYTAFSGEICPDLINQQTTAQIYLPRITHYRHRRMQFFDGGGKLITNTLGIHEPLHSLKPVSAKRFDLVLLPLVAFSRDGTRLGMGAGFYDRAFSFKHWQNKLSRPKLVGLAHHFQEYDNLPTQEWDVPLDAIITDQEIIII